MIPRNSLTRSLPIPLMNNSSPISRPLSRPFPITKESASTTATLGKGIGWDYVDRELDEAKIRYHHEWYPPGTQDFTPYLTRYNEAGCDIIYGAGDVMAAMLITKQRWEMGFKNWKTGTSGGILDPMMYINVSGMEASQGFMGQYFANWDFKKTKVDPKKIQRCQGSHEDRVEEDWANLIPIPAG